MDPSSATELLTHQYGNEQPIIPSNPRPNIAKSTPPVKAYPVPVGNENYCNSHPDEEVSYFCFDCLTPPVCSECVVHGIHKNHEVMHIKKGYPVVKERLEEIIQGLSVSIDGLEDNRKNLSNKKQLIINQGEEAKAQLKSIIDDLIARIEKKESELMKNIDTITNNSLRELESYEHTIEDKLTTLDNNIKYIQDNMEIGRASCRERVYVLV